MVKEFDTHSKSCFLCIFHRYNPSTEETRCQLPGLKSECIAEPDSGACASFVRTNRRRA